MTVKVHNVAGWIGGMLKAVEKFEKTIADSRRDVALALTEALMSNIPVWSGRTIRSITVSSGAGARVETHPDRGNTSEDGFFRFHPEFGKTNEMSLGSEPQRGASEAMARAAVDGASYDIDTKVVLSVASTAWSKIEVAAAPDPQKARNAATVSEIAKGVVRSRFGFVK